MGYSGEYVTAGKFANMVKGMIMKAFIYIYNIFIAQIRGLPREAGRGRDRWAARRGVVQHSKGMNKQIRPNRKLVRKLYKICSKALKDNLGINVASNSKHKDMIKPLIYISINNVSAESLKYANGFPSPDTLLRRLERLDLKRVVKALNEANRTILTGHAKDGMKMAIDFTEEPYYGKLDMYVTRSKYKSGTDRFHTFATISVVGKDEKERLTLYSLPMLDTKEAIVKKLLKDEDISLDD